MPDKFLAEDPRGITIVCSEEAWANHIAKARPWMNNAGYLGKVIRTLRFPDFILQDSVFPDRQNFYKKNVGNPNLMKVVVQVTENARGNVITAFIADDPKKGETKIWPE